MIEPRRAVRSRGRTLRSATRDRMRSTSPMARNGSRRRFEAARVHQQCQRLVAAPQFLLVGERAIEPATQLARAHGCDGRIEQRKQRGRILARQRHIDLEIAARRRVELQGIATFFHRQPGDVRQRGFLRLAHVLQQGAGGGDRQRQIVGTKAAQVERAQLIGQQARGAGQLEVPGRAHARGAIQQRAKLAGMILGNQQLGRLQPLELGQQRRVTIGFQHGETARGEIQPRQSINRAIFPRPPRDRG